MNSRRVILASAFAAALLAGGCAREVPLSDLSSGGAEVGVILTTIEGEELLGELLSITEREMIVVAHYRGGDGVEIEGFGDDRRVVVDGTRVEGEVIDVERVDGARVARVRRAIRVQDVGRATFHRSGQEVSMAAILSLLLGPSVGGLLGLVL